MIKKIIKTTEILRDEDLFLEKLSLEKFQDLRKEGKEKEIFFEISELRKLPISLKRRIIRLIIREVKGSLRRINFAHMEAILGIMKSPSPHLKVSLPDGLEVCKEYNHLRFSGISRKKVRFHHEFSSLPKEIRVPEIDRTIKIKTLDWNQGCLPITNANTALIDFDKLQFPIIVRNWEAGDRFQPLGTEGFKKVKDLFIDLKLPMKERQNSPLILFGDSIVWIGGQRIDERVKITNSTKKVIKMEFH